MALVDNAWYVDFGNGSTTGYYAIAQWTLLTSYSAGQLVRQSTAPAVGSERVFVCVVAGTSGAVEPTWTVTRGAKTTDSGVTWQECTGIAALNGDATNTPSWTISATPPGGVKNTAVTLGQVIKRDNSASYQICTTAGTAGNGTEPSFSDTAGTTTTDNTVTWTSLGVVGNFTGWQAPHARLENAYASTWGQAGNKFFISSGSAQTRSSATTLTSPGTLSSPCSVYSVNKTNVPPTDANIVTGASINTTGGSTINLAGTQYEYNSIKFQSGSGANNASIVLCTDPSSLCTFNNCTFQIGNTSASSRINLNNGGTGAYIKLVGCTFTFGGNASQNISATTANATIEIINCTFTSIATQPTTIITTSPIITNIRGTDFSLFGSGKTLIGLGSATNPRYLVMRNCKFGSSVTKAASITSPTQIVSVISSDSTGTGYNTEQYTYAGQQVIETTIVRTGGASDLTTPIAWKIDTNTQTNFYYPYEAILIGDWNDTTAANVTITVYGIWGGGAVPNNDDIWMVVQYMGESASPLSTRVNLGKASSLASNSALSSDTSTWGGSTTKFKLSTTLSSPQPAIKGVYYVHLFVAKASSTFYIDPRPILS